MAGAREEGTLMHRIAAIDIGTVTTRLLIADCNEGVTSDVVRELRITHLGEGLVATGKLSQGGIERVVSAAKEFVRIIAENNVDYVQCVATSAARDGSNGEDLLERLSTLGLEPMIISGDIEAGLSFAGASYKRRGQRLLVMDPGGGSTELIYGDTINSSGESARTIHAATSIDVGSRRITEMFLKSDPPTLGELTEARAYIRDHFVRFFDNLVGPIGELIGVAGTATTMATIKLGLETYNPDAINGTVITKDELSAILDRFVSVSCAQRKQIRGLEPARAGVIVAGALILEQALDLSECRTITISDNDLLYGIILERDAALTALS